MNFNLLKKVELHTHLDCSLSYGAVKKTFPDITIPEYKKKFIGSSCENLKDYLKCVERSVQIMQNKYQLILAVIDLFDQLQKDNVVYVEIRFAPLLHLKKGLNSAQVVEIILNQCKIESKKRKIKFGLILCTLRHFSESDSLQTVKLINDFNDENIVGFDLAADETAHPLDNHVKAFEFARENNIYCTSHAGEALGYQSVVETLDKLKTNRIGHGVRSYENICLLERLKKEKVHLEICPTSNLLTGVFSSLTQHPVNEFYKQNLSVGINTDGRAISNTTLNDEYKKLSEIFNWDVQHFLNCNINAMRASFTSEKIKEEIILELQNQ